MGVERAIIIRLHLSVMISILFVQIYVDESTHASIIASNARCMTELHSKLCKIS